ncbi:STAS domain-containing protein [Planosporangium sp. 12N6]|uniref:STAS domain-containing protein n=1 Tax=Planosporangium spinosum TaxID=3402278 RepID=UPI003CEDA941
MDEPVRVTDRGDGAIEVSLFGDIDFANSAAVRETVLAALTGAALGAVRVDLAAVTFLDSSGIALLVAAYRLATAKNAGFSVVNPTRSVYEHLRVTGLARLFGVARPALPAPGTTGGAGRTAPPVAS